MSGDTLAAAPESIIAPPNSFAPLPEAQGVADQQTILYRFTDRLYRAQDLAQVYEAALEAITAALDCERASILLFDETGVIRFVAWRGLSRTYRQAVEGHSPWNAGDTDPQPIWINDIAALAESEALKANIRAEGITALGMIPLVAGGGVVGKFMVYHPDSHLFPAREVDFATMIARQLGFSIEQKRSDMARHQAEESLRNSEAQLRMAIDAARMAVWEHDSRANSITTTPELNRLLGYAPDVELDLVSLQTRQYPGDGERIAQIAAAALARGERFFEAEFRFKRPDGVTRWFLVRAEIVLEPDGKPLRSTGVLLDITDRKHAEEALIEREGQLKDALDAGDLAIFDFDHLAGKMNSTGRLSEFYGYPADQVLTIGDIRARYHPDDEAEIIARAREDLVDPSLKNFSWNLRLMLPGGRIRWVEGLGEYVRDDAGRVVRSRGVVLDISERKRWEEHQRLLINELNHRVKNTLAIVQGLAQQSFRPGESTDRTLPAFESRLSALSAAHNLLTLRSWQAASVQQVVEATVQAAVGAAAGQMSWRGAEIQLSPQTAVSVALAMHELCTNAIKYGALSTDRGRVSIDWAIVGPSDDRRFHLEWRETDGPAVEPPQKRGFGSRMIERGLAAEFGGQARLDFDPAGLICTIDAPLSLALDPI